MNSAAPKALSQTPAATQELLFLAENAQGLPKRERETANAGHGDDLGLHDQNVTSSVEWPKEERLTQAMESLNNCVEVHADIRGGVPVIKGTRITAARVLAEVADGYSIGEIAEDLDLQESLLAEFMDGLSSYLNRPLRK